MGWELSFQLAPLAKMQERREKDQEGFELPEGLPDALVAGTLVTGNPAAA